MSLPQKRTEQLSQREWQDYKLRLAMMTSNDEIKRWMGEDTVIIRYCQLANYNTIEELLPYDGAYAFILVEEKRSKGHWTLISRYRNTVEFFDPTGIKFDFELSFIPKIIKRFLGEDKHFLTHLLKKAKWLKVIWNKKKFQKNMKGVNTCGRHCILRAIFMKMGYDLKAYQDLIQEEIDRTLKPSDVLVVDLIK